MQILPITPSSAVSAAASTQVAQTVSTSSTDSSNFMAMLMAQLKNQNPLQPMDDSQMMSQMTQLNSLQELQNLDTLLSQVAVSNQASYAASLIGKTVKFALDNGDTKEGLVTGSEIVNGSMELQMGEEEFPIGTVIGIKASQA